MYEFHLWTELSGKKSTALSPTATEFLSMPLIHWFKVRDRSVHWRKIVRIQDLKSHQSISAKIQQKKRRESSVKLGSRDVWRTDGTVPPGRELCWRRSKQPADWSSASELFTHPWVCAWGMCVRVCVGWGQMFSTASASCTPGTRSHFVWFHFLYLLYTHVYINIYLFCCCATQRVNSIAKLQVGASTWHKLLASNLNCVCGNVASCCVTSHRFSESNDKNFHSLGQFCAACRGCSLIGTPYPLWPLPLLLHSSGGHVGLHKN